MSPDTPHPEDRLGALNEALAHARRSAFYRDRLPAEPLRSIEQIRALPFTTKADLRLHGPGGLVCVPEREVAQYHESSATTGLPVSAWYSRRDLDEIEGRLSGWGGGFREDDRVLVRFPYALSTIGHFVHAAARSRGACVIPADSRSTISPLARVVELLRRLDVTILATMSLSAVMIAEVAEMFGLHPRVEFPKLRAIACAGEPVSPERRRLVEEIWGVPVLDNYGLTETGPLAMDCHLRRLHPFGYLFFLEVLDEPLRREVAPGEIGQLVVTSLTRRAMPVVRYVTGDRVRLSPRACGCGQTTTLEIRGREADTLWIQGRPFDLWTLSAIVGRLPARRFWRASPAGDALRIVVERERDGDRLDPGLIDALSREHGVTLDVELLPRGALYDRAEPISFGMSAKPVYVDRPSD